MGPSSAGCRPWSDRASGPKGNTRTCTPTWRAQPRPARSIRSTCAAIQSRGRTRRCVRRWPKRRSATTPTAAIRPSTGWRRRSPNYWASRRRCSCRRARRAQPGGGAHALRARRGDRHRRHLPRLSRRGGRRVTAGRRRVVPDPDVGGWIARPAGHRGRRETGRPALHGHPPAGGPSRRQTNIVRTQRHSRSDSAVAALGRNPAVARHQARKRLPNTQIPSRDACDPPDFPGLAARMPRSC